MTQAIKENPQRVRLGVLGGVRGLMVADYCKKTKGAELVAVCDFNPEVRAHCAARLQELGMDIAIVADFEELLALRPDGIVLANYATEHATFAIRCMAQGIAVLSEVLPAHTLRECVELVEAVEQHRGLYCYAENYCYMSAPRELKRLYQKGLLGELEYAEGEYLHNCEPIWHELTYGDPTHWRNNKHAFFYCTHSIGPIIHATGLRAETVIGMELPHNAKMRRMGAKGAQMSVEMLTLTNGAIVRSLHGQSCRNSIRFSMIGSHGKAESATEAQAIARPEDRGRMFVSLDIDPTDPDFSVDTYVPKNDYAQPEGLFHEIADLYLLDNFVCAIKGEPHDTIDVYEAMDMYLPGLFAYRSALNGGAPQTVPDFRKKEDRDLWRNDVACTDASIAGEQLQPTTSRGTPFIDPTVYQTIQKKWQDTCRSKEESL